MNPFYLRYVREYSLKVRKYTHLDFAILIDVFSELLRKTFDMYEPLNELEYE